MNRLISIHEAAEAEINESAEFHDLQSPGLGSEFLAEIERQCRIEIKSIAEAHEQLQRESEIT